MYDLFLKTLERLGINAPKWFFWIVLIVVILFGVNYLLKKYVKPIFDRLNDMKIKLDKTDEIDILKENQLRNKEHYKAADEELRKEIKKVTDKINVIAQMIVEMQEKMDDANKNKLKDRIREIYAVHHQTQKITLMEREALEGLIDTYLAAKGNSFVGKIIQPEIYCWQVVDDDYYEHEHNYNNQLEQINNNEIKNETDNTIKKQQ